jgi:zinc protease
MARKSPVEGITFIQELEGIKEYRLEKNGLRILLAPDTSSPVAGCMVTYHVGSRNEATGYTGATHILEHLMFKGSKHFNKETNTTVWDLLETKGAKVNATTWYDRTNYYEVVPKEHLATAIALEADRMRTARITAEGLASEMTVVRNEFERGENDSMEAVDKQIWAIAYQAHPYHHSTIGWRSDIEGVSIERLQAFYDEFYWPNNATVTIVGDFKEKDTLELIIAEFGKHTKAPHEFSKMYTSEPVQEGQRRAIVKRPGSDTIGIAHKVPSALHEDMPAILMLGSILSDGKTSRLYKALIDSGKALGVSCMCVQVIDPGLFETYVTMKPKTKHSDIEKIVIDEYQKISEKGVSSAELSRAKKYVRIETANKRNGTYALLANINEDIAVMDWTRFVTLPKKLDVVTAKDIQRVAKKYLVHDQSTVGWFINTAQ